MKKGASILLVLYAVTMLSYGSLEMGHDLLHYLASHHHTHLHDHEHAHDHHFSDHQQHDHHHAHVQYNHSDEAASELPSLINFFLFYEYKPSFSFFNSFLGVLKIQNEIRSESRCTLPATPPPQA